MNTFLVRYLYRDLDGRSRHRAEHLARLENLHAQGRVLIAGPLADLSGAVLIIKAPDQATAEALIAEDVYSRENVIGHVRVESFTVAVGG